MITARVERTFGAKLCLIVCTMLAAVGCTSGARRSSTSQALPDSRAFPDSIVAILRDCERLRKELDTRNEIILKLTSDIDRLGEVLEYAERQFISLERGLQNNETKASAVAALAEAKLAHNATLREDPKTHDLDVIQQSRGKIETSDKLLSQNRYAASVYFAKKALRLINDKDVRRNVRIIAVDYANIRRGPGMEYEVLAQLALGTVLFELGSDSSWYQVETVDGKAGWVHRSVTLTR